jgi:hypothetical protein
MERRDRGAQSQERAPYIDSGTVGGQLGMLSETEGDSLPVSDAGVWIGSGEGE